VSGRASKTDFSHGNQNNLLKVIFRLIIFKIVLNLETTCTHKFRNSIKTKLSKWEIGFKIFVFVSHDVVLIYIR
jgi:hypothetical protein